MGREARVMKSRVSRQSGQSYVTNAWGMSDQNQLERRIQAIHLVSPGAIVRVGDPLPPDIDQGQLIRLD